MTPNELAQIHAECFVTAPRPWDADEFAQLLQNPAVQITDCNDGFVVTRNAAGEAELLTIAVRPAARRRGIALDLLSRAMVKAKRAGAEVMFLEVADGNDAACGLYARIGFQEVGLRKNYYAAPRGEKISALVLKIEL